MVELRKLLCALAALGAASFGGINLATAEEAYPAQFIKMIVAVPPGGPVDLVGRALGEKVGAELGKPVVVENRPGGGTVVGIQAAARARPDGYTILNLTSSGVAMAALQKNLPYDLVRDFTPIIGIGWFPMVPAVPAASNIKSIADLAAATRSANGITYGSGGVGSLAHLAAVRLINELKGTGNHVPYRGNNDALQAVLGNQVQLFFASTAETLPFARSGQIRLLAVTSEQRFSGLPDVPTMKEAGFSDFNPRLWQAIMAPAGTPASIVSRLHDAFARAVLDPSVQGRLNAVGFAAEVREPAALSLFINEEAARWSKVIKENNIKIGS
jgi:tripartite-type tricarboxylate transporter receptor subunit TctC